MIVEIHRHYEPDASIGTLIIDNRVLCFTLERPNRGNLPFLSSIPADTYICRRHESPKFGETFKVTNVYGRTDILFHIANKVSQLHGCIATGTYVGYLDGERAVLNSGKAFELFMQQLHGIDEFKLIIK